MEDDAQRRGLGIGVTHAWHFLKHPIDHTDVEVHMHVQAEAEPVDDGWIKDEQRLIPVRVCAIKKCAAQTRKAQDKVRQESAKDKRVAQPQTMEAAGYVVVLSTLMQPSAHTL